MTGRFRRSRRETAGLAEPHTIKTVSLALQGGGAHGALTWGVLDALLEDGRLGVEAITGASAGAMNAVVLVQGWLEGGGTAGGPSLAPACEGADQEAVDGQTPASPQSLRFRAVNSVAAQRTSSRR